MVILIGGSSHVGKTLLAQKLLEKYHWPYLSLDHLKMGFIRSGKTELTVQDDYEMRYFLWPFVAEMIRTVIEGKQNLIVEGCYIPAEWQESFSEDELRKIRCVFVVMSEAYLRGNFDAVRSCANAIESRAADDPDLERLIRCSQSFKSECIEHGIPCLEICERFDIDELVAEAEKLMGL
ncbi:MAG: adenylate kinase [Oscillospiraceae bacterium]|nr:adenylate kinase [Oscillospiraceae bacterium]